MDEMELERQRQLRLKALQGEQNPAIESVQNAFGIAPSKPIQADPSVLESLYGYVFGDAKQKAPAAPAASPLPAATDAPEIRLDPEKVRLLQKAFRR